MFGRVLNTPLLLMSSSIFIVDFEPVIAYWGAGQIPIV